MKIKNQIVGPHEVRLTRQSKTARYGAGCYVVRRLSDGQKCYEESTSNRERAEFHFDREVRFCQALRKAQLNCL